MHRSFITATAALIGLQAVLPLHPPPLRSSHRPFPCTTWLSAFDSCSSGMWRFTLVLLYRIALARSDSFSVLVTGTLLGHLNLGTDRSLFCSRFPLPSDHRSWSFEHSQIASSALPLVLPASSLSSNRLVSLAFSSWVLPMSLVFTARSPWFVSHSGSLRHLLRGLAQESCSGTDSTSSPIGLSVKTGPYL